MNKKLKSLDFWTEKFSEKTAQIFIDRKLIPVNLIYWTDDDIANLVNDENIYQKIIALRNKIIIKKDRIAEKKKLEIKKNIMQEEQQLLEKEEEILAHQKKIMEERKKIIWFKKEIEEAEKIESIPKKPDKALAEAPSAYGIEDENNNEEEDKDASEDDIKLEIERLPRSGTRVVKKLSMKDIKIPQFSNNIKFLQDVDAILKIEQAEDSWFEVVIKSIPWESGGSLLYEHKQLIIDLEWQLARKKIIEILEPNFYLSFHEKLLRFRLKNETMKNYYTRFNLFIFYNNAIDEKLVTQIYLKSLPNFIQQELKRMKVDGSIQVTFSDIKEIDKYTQLILEDKYHSQILNITKNYFCEFCKMKGHTEDYCRAKKSNKNLEKSKTKFESERKAEEIQKNEKKSIPNEKKDITCFKCNQVGHYANKCPKAKATAKVIHSNIEGIIDNNPIFVELEIEGTLIKGLLDTGASHTILNINLANQLNLSDVQNGVTLQFADGREQKGRTCKVIIAYKNIKNEYQIIVSNVVDSLIIGRDLIYKLNLLHNLSIEENIQDKQEMIAKIENLIEINISQTKQFQANIPSLNLQLIDPLAKSYIKQYRIAYVHHKIIDDTLKEWLEKKIIQIANEFDFNSSILTAPKKNLDGSISEHLKRICVDFRHVNKLLMDDTNDLPIIDEIIEEIGDSQFYSKMDLDSAYLQVGLAEESRRITNFTWKGNSFNFCRIPFGLKMAPSFFQRNIRNILQKENCTDFSTNYFDDIIIHSNDWENHVGHLEKVIKALTKNNLTIKKEKSVLFQTKLEILGHIVSKGRVEINFNKVSNMLKWERPINRRSMSKLLGILNYFRKYIPFYPDLTEQFTSLLHGENLEWQWTDELEEKYKKNIFNFSKFILL